MRRRILKIYNVEGISNSTDRFCTVNCYCPNAFTRFAERLATIDDQKIACEVILAELVHD
ncbi:hypothetical protein LQZ18_11105 [Lachnospiraceae bacterium ZAX-1]